MYQTGIKLDTLRQTQEGSGVKFWGCSFGARGMGAVVWGVSCIPRFAWMDLGGGRDACCTDEPITYSL